MNRKIIILISLICFSILLGGCIDNKEDGNNKKADEQFIVIRIKSISFTNETYEDRIYIDLMIGNINNTILFKENTWQNVIRLNSPKNNEEYPFKIEASVGSNNSETFDFIGDFNYFCGNITFSNEEIIIEINPLFDSLFSIEENDLYLKNIGYTIITTGNDGNMNILIAIEHPPPD